MCGIPGIFRDDERSDKKEKNQKCNKYHNTQSENPVQRGLQSIT